MRFWPLVAAALLYALPGFSQIEGKNPDLERAQQSLEALRYAEAGKALDAAWQAPGNDREAVLEILKLQAVVAASLGQQDRARSLFNTLLYLAPDFELPESDLGPKVMSLFYEAKGRVSVGGALKAEPGPINRDERLVHDVTLKVTDAQKLARAVRFHSRPPVLNWSEEVVPLQEGQASLSVEAPAVEWWAEVLGEKDRVLFRLGSADQPIGARVLVPEGSRQLLVVSGGAGPNLKPVAYVVAGAGVVAGITGLVFGIRSNNQKNQIVASERDADGRVTGISRARALEVNELQKTSATLANALFATAIVLVGTGVVLYLVSPDVSVSASPSGLAFAGSFP